VEEGREGEREGGWEGGRETSREVLGFMVYVVEGCKERVQC
jgi:hypothetical protein